MEPRNPITAMLESALEVRKAQLDLEIKNKQLEAKVEVVENKAEEALTQVDILTANMMSRSDCLTALAYSKKCGFKIPTESLGLLGKKMCKYLRNSGRGDDIRHVHDERWNEVVSYSMDVLDKFYPDFQAAHNLHNGTNYGYEHNVAAFNRICGN